MLTILLSRVYKEKWQYDINIIMDDLVIAVASADKWLALAAFMNTHRNGGVYWRSIVE